MRTNKYHQYWMQQPQYHSAMLLELQESQTFAQAPPSFRMTVWLSYRRFVDDEEEGRRTKENEGPRRNSGRGSEAKPQTGRRQQLASSPVLYIDLVRTITSRITIFSSSPTGTKITCFSETSYCGLRDDDHGFFCSKSRHGAVVSVLNSWRAQLSHQLISAVCILIC